jgi:hypothetical protein
MQAFSQRDSTNLIQPTNPPANISALVEAIAIMEYKSLEKYQEVQLAPFILSNTYPHKTRFGAIQQLSRSEYIVSWADMFSCESTLSFDVDLKCGTLLTVFVVSSVQLDANA